MKNFAYFAAISVAVIAQAASALVIRKPVVYVNVANQAVTLKVITPRSTAAAASVTLENGVVWSFNGSGDIGTPNATVAGVMVCLL